MSHLRKRTWQLQEAKAKFSQVIDQAIDKGFQVITRHGEPIAVIISKKEFDEYLNAKDNLIDFFMKSPYPDFDLEISRDKDTGRDVEL